MTHDRAAEIEYRVEVWGTRPGRAAAAGHRVEAWSDVFQGDAWSVAAVRELVRLGEKGWTNFAVFVNGRQALLGSDVLLGAAPPAAEGEPVCCGNNTGADVLRPGETAACVEAEAIEEPEDLEKLEPGEDQAQEGAGDEDPGLAGVRGIDGDEQRMLFR